MKYTQKYIYRGNSIIAKGFASENGLSVHKQNKISEARGGPKMAPNNPIPFLLLDTRNTNITKFKISRGVNAKGMFADVSFPSKIIANISEEIVNGIISTQAAT